MLTAVPVILLFFYLREQLDIRFFFAIAGGFAILISLCFFYLLSCSLKAAQEYLDSVAQASPA